MTANIKIGRIWGIPIGVNISWFFIFGLITWSLAAGYFPTEYPSLSTAMQWILGLVTSLLFFGSVLAHELGHSYLALRNKIPVNNITLYIFGGVAQISQEPPSPGTEFLIALAGPFVSLTLAFSLWIIWLLTRSIPLLAAPSLYLWRINLILGLFNLVPGFPLDGGRVLRSIVWRLTGSFHRATQIASYTGQLVAFGFIGLGIITMVGGNYLDGLWLIFIGWFVQNAAVGTYAQSNMLHNLRGVTVSQVMTQDCQKVTNLMSLNQLVEEHVLTGGQRCFFIDEDGKLRGMLTLRDIAAVPRSKWRFTTPSQVMVPFNRLVRVEPNTELLAALQLMDQANVAQVPVVMGEEIVGMLSREQIVHYLRTRAELGI
jgi:Zn-dependent protease